jgi:hypothetical protein
LIVFGVPLGFGGDVGASQNGGSTVVEGDSVVGKPGCERLTSACGDSLREATFELEEEEDTGAQRRLSKWAKGGSRTSERIEAGRRWRTRGYAKAGLRC